MSSASPTILIVTATSVETENLNSTIDEISNRKLKVDVVTFGTIKSPRLLQLTPYGAVYSSKLWSDLWSESWNIGKDLQILCIKNTMKSNWSLFRDILDNLIKFRQTLHLYLPSFRIPRRNYKCLFQSFWNPWQNAFWNQFDEF